MKKILILLMNLFFIITLTGCNSFQYKKELNNYKEDAITSIDDILQRYDSSLYSESEWDMIVEYINEGKKQIKIATTKDQINDIIYETKKSVKSIEPSNKPVAPVNPVTVPKMNREEPFTEGDGTIEAPYIIDSKGKLIYFSNCVNKGIGADAYYELKTNIDLKGIRWIPIGALYYRGFKGHFNGNGYEISNCEIFDRLDDYVGENVGIFGHSDGVIENLGVINLNIDIEWSRMPGEENDIDAGGVAGFNEGVIRNCYSIGKMNLNCLGGGLSLPHVDVCSGGICGVNNGGIYNCYSQIDIKVVYKDGKGHIDMAGISYNRYGEIENCLSIYTGTFDTYYEHKFEQKIGLNNFNSYFYYENPLVKNSIDGEGLNQVEFYTDKLGWSQDIWDFSEIAFENGKYLENKHPKLKKNN